MATKESETRPNPNNEKAKAEKTEALHTDNPLSEKDEVKQAEHNTNKQQNKGK